MKTIKLFTTLLAIVGLICAAMWVDQKISGKIIIEEIPPFWRGEYIQLETQYEARQSWIFPPDFQEYFIVGSDYIVLNNETGKIEWIDVGQSHIAGIRLDIGVRFSYNETPNSYLTFFVIVEETNSGLFQLNPAEFNENTGRVVWRGDYPTLFRKID